MGIIKKGLFHILNSVSTSRYPLIVRKLLSEYIYKKNMGEPLQLNNPQLFTQKVRWYELYYLHPDMPRIVDKFCFKKYIKEKLGQGYTIPLYGMWTSIKDLKRDWEKLPEEFCLKSTICDNGRNIKIIRNKKQIDIDAFVNDIKEWLNPKNTLINSYCNAYYGTVPRIIAEEYCENVAGQLYDYKIYCFSGKPYCFYAAAEHMNHNGNSYPISFYDLSWNKMDVSYGSHPPCDIECPKHLVDMVNIASKLCKDFPFVRVDFFDTVDRLFVAELTFYPGGGLTHYYPRSFDKKMGDLFTLPSNITIWTGNKFKKVQNSNKSD